MHLKVLGLFQSILKHGFVPNSFGCGKISIPLIKDKTGNFNDMDNYRAIIVASRFYFLTCIVLLLVLLLLYFIVTFHFFILCFLRINVLIMLSR